jgi:hypothetical protein
MKMTNLAIDLVPLYIKEIVRLHGMPKSMFQIGPLGLCLFFWQSLHSALGMKRDTSTAFHPWTDG